VPLGAVAGGTTFGTMVHEVLEAVDFTAADLDADVADQVAAGLRRAGLDLDAPTLAAGLVAAIVTPLGPLFRDRALRSFAAADRMAELGFDLRLGDGSTSAPAPAVPAGAVGEILAQALPDDHPLRPYFADLGVALGPVDLRGWLTGSLDAVFRVDDTASLAGGARFVVVDYKSNRVHDPSALDATSVLAAYRPDRLAEAMVHSHYPLQAALYVVALHRYLAWRLGDRYDPDRHLGGVAYLFVRGMTGPTTPTHRGQSYGVFSWAPPVAAVTALDELLRGGRR
jgi:exodeoxyribonuclease V beta subunit